MARPTLPHEENQTRTGCNMTVSFISCSSVWSPNETPYSTTCTWNHILKLNKKFHFDILSATKADAWRNLWTISLHKIFAAVAMGIALLRLIPKRPFLLTVVYSFAFAISSPIGVGIGIAIDATSEGATADWIYAISMGIACGVFVYVAIHHLISKGFKPQKDSYFDTPYFKFLAVLTGVGVIAVVMIWD